MSNSKITKSRIRGSAILVASPTKKMFKDYCSSQKVDMQQAANEILLFILKNKISLSDLDNMMDKNITKEVLRYHNYTVGFLKEFEKKQLELMKKLIGIVEGEGAGESIILKIFLQEILKDQQFLMLQSPDINEAKSMINSNDNNIKKVLDDNKN